MKMLNEVIMRKGPPSLLVCRAEKYLCFYLRLMDSLETLNHLNGTPDVVWRRIGEGDPRTCNGTIHTIIWLPSTVLHKNKVLYRNVHNLKYIVLPFLVAIFFFLKNLCSSNMINKCIRFSPPPQQHILTLHKISICLERTCSWFY